MPWCVRKCPYCDFNSHQLKAFRPDEAYVDALLRDFESELPRIDQRRVATVFFGGGTPSLFTPAQFARLLLNFRQRIDFAPGAEITLEANPGTIERGDFAGYRDAGINRVSIGAQTFAPAALSALGRIHSAEDTQRAVAELRAARIDNFNLDLMFGLPGQSLEQALEDVRIACELKPAHISYYQLTLEPGTVFGARPPQLPDEELVWQIQTAGQQMLAAAGFQQYEVSAYAQPGARCRHNLNYWLFGDYAGLGAGAHGKLTAALPGRILRTTKPKQPGDYQRAAARCASTRGSIGEGVAVGAAELPFEFMLNAMRLNEGFTLACYQERTGLGLPTIEAKLAAAEQRGLVLRRIDGWKPSEFGLRFLNDLLQAFLI